MNNKTTALILGSILTASSLVADLLPPPQAGPAPLDPAAMEDPPVMDIPAPRVHAPGAAETRWPRLDLDRPPDEGEPGPRFLSRRAAALAERLEAPAALDQDALPDGAPVLRRDIPVRLQAAQHAEQVPPAPPVPVAPAFAISLLRGEIVIVYASGGQRDWAPDPLQPWVTGTGRVDTAGLPFRTPQTLREVFHAAVFAEAFLAAQADLVHTAEVCQALGVDRNRERQTTAAATDANRSLEAAADACGTALTQALRAGLLARLEDAATPEGMAGYLTRMEDGINFVLGAVINTQFRAKRLM